MPLRILFAVIAVGGLILLIYWGYRQHDLVGTLITMVLVGAFVVTSAIMRRRRNQGTG